MGWLDELQGHHIGLDTAPLIYYIEEHPAYLPFVEPFFNAIDKGELTVVTSTITLLETLVYPLKQGRTDLVNQYEQILLNINGLQIIDLSPPIAKLAAQMRATYNLRTPDAIQLATAVNQGATYFFTNDRSLQKIKELTVFVLDFLR